MPKSQLLQALTVTRDDAEADETDVKSQEVFKISEEELQAIFLQAKFAPSAGDAQPFSGGGVSKPAAPAGKHTAQH